VHDAWSCWRVVVELQRCWRVVVVELLACGGASSKQQVRLNAKNRQNGSNKKTFSPKRSD
jgi:hypothetical protein